MRDTNSEATEGTPTGTANEEPSSARPGGWLVAFDLPYFVSVVDSMDDPVLRRYAEAVAAGETPLPVPYSPRPSPHASIVVGGVQIHVPDPAGFGEPFEIPQVPGAVQLSFLRRLRNVDRSVVLSGELRPDSGAASFSSASVRFDIALSRTFRKNDLGPVADAALEATNAFLKQYRHFTGAYWAYPLDRTSVVEFLIWRLYDNGRGSASPAVHTAPAGGPLRTVGTEPLVNPTNDKAIRAALSVGQESPLAFQMLLSAQEHIHRKRYGNAAIDAATSFEVFLNGFIRFHMTARGHSARAIDEVFKSDAGGYLPVTSLAKDILRTELQIDFGETPEHRNWKRNVADVRNTVVHTATLPTRDAALAAVRDVDRARSKLQELAATMGG